MFGESQSDANCFRKLIMENTFTFNLHNTKLHAQYWKPQTVKSVIVLIYGMGEHKLRFENSVIKHLVNSGCAVVAFDLYGHGSSEGKRGHCPNYNALFDAVEKVIEKSKVIFPDKRILLYGHSLGANIAINYTLKRKHNLKGVIASSPFLRLAFQPPKWKVQLGKIMLNIYPSITLPSEIDASAISRDLNEVKRYAEDPLIHGKISPMYLFPIVDAGEWAIKNANKLKTPMLVLHGTDDKLIDHKGSIEFCDNSKYTQLELFEKGYHELHHDTCIEEFIETILKWLATN